MYSEIRILLNHAYHLKIYLGIDLKASSVNRQCFKIQQCFK